VVSNLAAASKAAQEGNMMELTAQIRRSLDHRTELSRLAEVASLKQLWGGWNSPYGPLGQATDQVTAAQQWTPDPRLHGHALTGALMGGMDWVLQPLNGRQRIEATDGIALLMAGGSGWYLPRAGVIWAGRPAGLPTASPEATRLSWEPELVLVARDGQQRSYLVNSMARGKESRVLVGVGVDELLQELATLGNCIAAVQLDNQWVAAAQPHGKLANLFLLPPLSLAGQAGSVNARIGENEDAYRYSSFPLTQQGKAQLVILRSEKALFAPVLHLQDLLQGLVAQVRRHLLAAHAVALLVVLCLVWIVTRRMTRPLTLLARATRPLMEGHYEEVILPVYHGRDEIGELIGEFEVMRSGLREKAKVQDVLNKVVSPEVAAQIMKTGVALGGEERKVTILFADIRNFTGMSDKLTPVQTVELLNGCMTRVARAIERHNGVIDKFVGDEVMAIYNAPLSHPDPAAAAIASGLEIVEEMRLWNVERETQGLPPVQMGVGIHTGVVVAGNMGAQDRLNYTVIGSNVNLAARLCSYAKGMQVVISDATWSGEGVAQQFVTEKLPPATLKGIPNPVPLFLVTGKR
jgi:class 3 adenylate cyclase